MHPLRKEFRFYELANLAPLSAFCKHFKMSKNSVIRLIDIGANLIDSMYDGVYNGSRKHSNDIQQVLQRSWANGLSKIIVTGTSLDDSKAALDLASKNSNLYSTAGCHPTNCTQIEEAQDPKSYIQSLVELCEQNKRKIVALGEFGLDYDRLNFCGKETQKKWFKEQLCAFEGIKLPLFLHCRNASEDLLSILSENREKFVGGVVHSFDGSEEEAKKILDLGLYIGVNGCSLRKEENLQVIKQVPLDRLLIETDSPWCEVKSTHASFKYVKTQFPSVKKEKWQPDKLVKGRNEPCNVIQILEILAAIKEEDIHSVGDIMYKNSEKLFFQ